MELTQEYKNDIFWKQYHGLVRAIDLPNEYKEYDTRICCCTDECSSLVRDKCELWKRYVEGQQATFRLPHSYVKSETKKNQKGLPQVPWKVEKFGPTWYYTASFDLWVEESGSKCSHFIPIKTTNK
ncbi:MAG: hypothetical protein MJZ30_06270 [Paludibacteraceae bacterium]|nr:hypothetical protein [Paludibacteraceae bacterium]